MDIVEFLTARLDWTETVALAAQKSDPAPWSANVSTDAPGTELRSGHGAGLVVASDGTPLWDCEGSNMLCMTVPASAHVALHDPAHVLRDVQAKREIVEDYVLTCRVRDEADARIKAARASGRIDSAALDDWHRADREASILEGVVQRLASPYAEHPDYDPSWSTE